ncbi:MAG TPA: copper-binding protein [Bryobacteraceae bacterium]|nr:copper-binding protein [Bryobacteraceae bacterium]
MTRRAILIAAAALALAGCARQQTEEAAKRYPMRGEILSLDPLSKSANIKAGKIEGWMEAMTMDYRIKPDAEFAKLHVGDQIQATVVVNDLSWYATDVKVLPKQ